MSLAVPVAVAIVVAARVALGPLRAVPDHDNADFNRFVAVEKYEFRERPKPPRAIVTGSSRTQYGIETAVLGETLGLVPDTVANLSVPAGNPWTSLAMLRRNPSLLVDCKVILVDLAPLQFNARAVPSTNRFAHLASLPERLALDHHPRKAALVIDSVVGQIGIRRSLRSYGLALANHRRGTVWGGDDRERLAPAWSRQPDHAKLRDELFAENTAWRPENHAEETFRDWRESRFLWDQLRELAAFARDRDILLILHQPPFHPDYLASIRANPTWNRIYEDYKELALGLDGDGASVFLFEDPAELGIAPEAILDYGHFGREAAETYSRALGGKVRDFLP